MMHRHFRLVAVASVVVLATVHPPVWGDAVPVCPGDGRAAEKESSLTGALCVVEDHARHEGAFIVLDARVRNASARTVADASVSVELYTAAGHLVDVEDSVVRPDRLEPDQEGTVLIVASYEAGIDGVRNLFTWQQVGRAHHGVAGHAIASG